MISVLSSTFLTEYYMDIYLLLWTGLVLVLRDICTLVYYLSPIR